MAPDEFVPAGEPAISGTAEADAFARLPEPPQAEVERVAHLVLMALLPAAVDGDLAMFGGALTEIQRITGAWFAPVQGDTFAAGATRDLIELLTRHGAAGVGQSSWGPTLFAIGRRETVETVAKGLEGNVVVTGARKGGADIVCEQ